MILRFNAPNFILILVKSEMDKSIQGLVIIPITHG